MIGGDVRIDTYEQLAELPIDAVIRDADGDIARKREAIPQGSYWNWQVLGQDTDRDGYLTLAKDTYLHLPVDVLWPR